MENRITILQEFSGILRLQGARGTCVGVDRWPSRPFTGGVRPKQQTARWPGASCRPTETRCVDGRTCRVALRLCQASQQSREEDWACDQRAADDTHKQTPGLSATYHGLLPNSPALVCKCRRGDIAGGSVASAKMMAGPLFGDREGSWGTQNDRAFDMGDAERSAAGNYVGRGGAQDAAPRGTRHNTRYRRLAEGEVPGTQCSAGCARPKSAATTFSPPANSNVPTTGRHWSRCGSRPQWSQRA